MSVRDSEYDAEKYRRTAQLGTLAAQDITTRAGVRIQSRRSLGQPELYAARWPGVFDVDPGGRL